MSKNSFTKTENSKNARYQFKCVLQTAFAHKQTGNARTKDGEPLAIYYGYMTKPDQGLSQLNSNVIDKMNENREFKVGWLRDRQLGTLKVIRGL